MKDIPAIYLGRIVSKENFRAYIYGNNEQKKLVESWDEFESHMATGLWFASLSDLSESIEQKKLRTSKQKSEKKNDNEHQ